MGEWIRFVLSAGFLVVGVVFMALAVFGVNRFGRALNRMHAAAMGDTLGILFVFVGLMLMRGFSMDSLKLLLVILFFWLASPVSGHMISRLEAMTDEDLGELLVICKGVNVGDAGTANIEGEAMGKATVPEGPAGEGSIGRTEEGERDETV